MMRERKNRERVRKKREGGREREGGTREDHVRVPNTDLHIPRSVHVQLLQSQPVRWEVQQEVAWKDDALASHHDDTARPMVVGIIEMNVLDLTLDRCPGLHGVCRTEY